MVKLLRKGSGILAIASVMIIAACNNEASSDQSANNASADTKTDSPSTKAARKTGKVSAKMDAATKGDFKKDAKGVYTNVEVQPQYPGGEPALSDFMANTIVYPDAAIDQSTEGTVRVEFVVNENGKVSDAVAQGTALGNGLEQAAVDVINKMPEWTPGKVNGKNVKTRLVLPVTYRLE